jgi:hypothetical protein
MSTITIEELKDKFSAGKYPKEGDYEDLIDTLLEQASLLSGGVIVSADSPTDPKLGDLWFNTSTVYLYVYVDGFWIEVA